MFFSQKENKVALYLRKNHKIYAWTTKHSSEAFSSLFRRLDVLVLLDPDDDDGGAKFKLGKMKLLYAASNNKKHINKAAMKGNKSMQAFLGPPLDRELPVILKCLNPELTQAVIKDRKDHVGNLIRYILDETKYTARLEDTKSAARRCAQDPILLENAVLDKGFSNGNDTIPGTLFQILPTRPDDLSKMGYDGQGVEYRKLVVRANNAILTACQKLLGQSQWISFVGGTNK